MGSNEFEGSPRTWPPLGMPKGSVRALLTLVVVAVVVTRLARGDESFHDKDHDLLWIETLLIAMSHYFTSRRFVELPPDTRRQLEDDGVIDRERNPLFLPQNSIRVFIVCAFGGLAYYLFREGRLGDHHAASLLGMLGAFMLGAAIRRIGQMWHRNQPRSGGGTLGDLKALCVLLMMLIVAVPEFLNQSEVLPPFFHRLALGMMLFYFGSR